MATSNVSIANLALQKLGEPSIVSLSEDSRNGRAMNACFEAMRDRELRAYFWNFAKKRASLAASAVVPISGFALAFPLPTDFLRLIKSVSWNLDWQLEQHEGVLSILTGDSAPLLIRYIARVTDPTRFDPIFVEMFACKLAWQTCETITQSNSKKTSINEEYLYHRAEGRRTNAFELPAQNEPPDDWLMARRVGGRPDLRFGDA